MPSLFAGETINTSADLVLYEIPGAGPIANASALAAALCDETVGNFNFGHNLPNSTIIDFLVAYANTTGGINIADVEVHNGSGHNITDTGLAGLAHWV